MALSLWVVWAGASPASGQDLSRTELDRNIELMRARPSVGDKKSNWIRSNVPLTEREAEIFWPLYRRYQRELDKLGEERLALIEDYAAHYANLTDTKARAILDQSFAIESKIQTIRRLYKNEFLTVLAPKVVARFFQVERRLNLLIDLEVASKIPLIE